MKLKSNKFGQGSSRTYWEFYWSLSAWFHHDFTPKSFLNEIPKKSFKQKKTKPKKLFFFLKCQVVILRKNSRRSHFLFAPNSIFCYLELCIAFVFICTLCYTLLFKREHILHLNLSYWTFLLFSRGMGPARYNMDIEIKLNQQHLRNAGCSWTQHPMFSVFLFH